MTNCALHFQYYHWHSYMHNDPSIILCFNMHAYFYGSNTLLATPFLMIKSSGCSPLGIIYYDRKDSCHI